VRFLVLFSDKQYGEMIEMIEVAHEALIRNWKQLRDWLKECREALRKKRKIEDAAEEWKFHKKSKDYLLQGRSLRDAREFMQGANKETALSSLATEFVKISHRKQRQELLKSATFFCIFPAIGTLIAIHLFLLNLAQTILNSQECKQDSQVSLLLKYKIMTGDTNNLERINLCREDLSGINLKGLTLWKADFKWTVLEGANLQKAYLVGVDFKGANLENVDFSGALLENVNFDNSYLDDAELEKAKGMKIEQLNKANLCRTKLPKGLNLDPSRDCGKRKIQIYE
jgi:uncharacterized protein YjbI with pentapeptide repeats